MQLLENHTQRISLIVGKCVLLFMGILITGFISGCSISDKNEIKKLQDTIMKMKVEKKKDEFFFKKQEQQIAEFGERMRRLPVLSELEAEFLKTKGLVAPEKELAEDLKKHLELIPQNDGEDPEMNFLNVSVLSHKWVFTAYGYDKTVGYLLLSYEIFDDARITWQRMDSFLITDIGVRS